MFATLSFKPANFTCLTHNLKNWFSAYSRSGSCFLHSLLVQCLISVSIEGKRCSRTSPTTSSDMTTKKPWKLESRFVCFNNNPNKGCDLLQGSVFFSICRQCALVALEDVKTYLNEEGGQIAVRIRQNICLCVFLLKMNRKLCFWNVVPVVFFRFLMPPTPPERGGSSSLTLQRTMPTKWGIYW